MNKSSSLFILLFSISLISLGQNDSLVLNNGNTIIGDLKSMDKGVLTIEPPYSDSDFKIKWEDIKEMKALQRYLITLSDGQRINGSFSSVGEGKIFIDNEDGEDLTVDQNDIVNINSVDSSFLSRLSANIDFGFSLTKANNQQQLNGNLRMGYLADRWSLELYYNTLITTQDGVDDIQRNDAGLGFRYFLPADWNLSADIDFLSNTEQSLDLRTTAKMGVGNYIKHTNSLYWNVSGGVALNNETFSPVFNPDDGTSTTAPSRNSMEGYIGTELNLYDIGDLNLFTNLTLYPTIISDPSVASGRFRTDFRFDAKYDDVFIKDFYVRAGYTLNYDNRPAEAGKEVDYIFTTGFGWEW
ncbi:DUF481 domain-containing protein [uncultured Algibacter sp.]|uniref:DUF481 domain-containing protein n=1 Tax=uncultured Algibacter sp. TaxID=298659 RepID=UPI002611B694|nr:DUF481 domain-containing protein [uncultured Algibacter sp.]